MKYARVLFKTTNPNDLRNFKFPKKCVIKANHGSNMNIILKQEPSEKKLQNIIKKCQKFLKTTYGKKELFRNEEPHYAQIDPLVFVEEYLDDGGQEPVDYKFHVCDGEIMYIQVDMGRFGKHTRQIFDSSFRKLNVKKSNTPFPKFSIEKPYNFEKMVHVCKKFYELTKLKYARIDLYELDSQLYFGEFTFSPGGARTKFHPQSFDNYLYKQYINCGTK